MNISFKKVPFEQADELLKIAKETFIHTYSHLNDPEQFSIYVNQTFTSRNINAQLNNAQTHYYFGLVENNTVSYCQLLESPHQTDLNTAHSLEIARFYILDNWKGKGIGGAMMGFIKELAMELGKTEIWLGVWEKNLAGISFYEKMNFSHTGAHSFMIGSDEQTDFIMKYSPR